MNIMGHIENGMQQLAIANSIKAALIGALTEKEQVSLSMKIMGNLDLLPNMFITWVNTEDGKLAVRELVSKFTGESK